MSGTSPSQRYQITERLDAGGMAEVFKAKATSMEGFEKVVAIKRVLPSLTKKERFVQMFLDEAKLALFLNHTNIVQTFDIGEADGTYFIVMEFVEGANLKTILNHLGQRGKRFSIEEATFITMEICKGLTYAHEKRADDGHELGIVHRDISPPNVLVSRQGEVKIADFGLAKARTQIELTDPGVVKGKFGYLSPEAAQGETVDAQTDLFAVGIVLWEMLAGRRLFLGKTDMDTLDLVRRAEIPSVRNINSDVPVELERLVFKALALDKNDRFESSGEMNEELARFLFSRGVAVTSRDLAAVVREMLNEKPRRRPSKNIGGIDLLIQDEINKFISLEKGDIIAESFDGLGSQPLSAEEFSPPGTDLGFEDPRTWADTFGDAADVSLDNITGAGGKRQPTLPRTATPAQPPKRSPTPIAPNTRDAGAGAQTSKHARRGPEPPVGPPMPEPFPDPGAMRPERPTSSSGTSGGSQTGWWIVFGVLLVLVVLALSFLVMTVLNK